MKQTSYQTQREQLKAKMAELQILKRDHEPLKIENAADPIDLVQALAERNLLVDLLNRDAQLRHDLRRAFDSIENGMYGTCEDCGGQISATRLKAIPWAQFCLRCQEQRDRDVNEADFLTLHDAQEYCHRPVRATIGQT